MKEYCFATSRFISLFPFRENYSLADCIASTTFTASFISHLLLEK